MGRNGKQAERIFAALESRRLDELASLYHPSIAFHWPPGLPYSGDHVGHGVMEMTKRFSEVWAPLQADEQTRNMDARVVAETGDEVVVYYIWRGKNVRGETFETATSAHYRFQDGLLADARMFHYDLVGLIAFVEDACR